MAVDDAALERLRDDLLAAISAAILDSEHRIRGELAEAISGSEHRVRGELAEAISGSQHGIRGELAEAISASEARLGARIDASAAETRRHMGVVAEGLKSNIALVAEGVVTLTERLSAEMREGVEIIDRRLLRVETRLLSTGSPGPCAGGGTAEL
jgi:hypothetical protein